ncbi:SGNH/GDSL hydrolase family protein [Sphingomonas montanisoli]|uniref:SGNH/GDSL hydrolase family protein n=1 Tax=Sphingomonas montanisoli TaxID=2606412 RepID=A0A5D9C2X6_9SPHN|nr:SGNH/GDSL hydrolase family protein [Sphingomonas montanisoli]TZG26218.1 SGNH/GDSL hydrolase family protein [Sphingomonas montanisoli]
MMSLLALAAAAAATPVVTADCAGGLCGYPVLKPYFEKLTAARGRSGKPVHILQIGDSHTAGDAITGAWRDMLQARYGSGGRGMMPPGKPFNGYNPRGVSVDMSDGWSIASIFGPGSQTPHPPVGLAGFNLTSTRDGARISMVAGANEQFDRFVVCAMAQPGAGTLAISIGGKTERIALDAFLSRPECKELTFDAPQVAVSVVAEGRPVTITSWASFRDTGGVALSNAGVVGSQLVHFSRNDDAVVAEELRAYDPDLIVVAFGTNEGFSPRIAPQEYEITLRTQISRIRRLAGRVPILLLGAPDALTRRSELLSNAPTATPAPCLEPAPLPPVAPVAPPPSQIAPDSIDDILGELDAQATQTVDGRRMITTPPPATAPLLAPPPVRQPTQIGWSITARPLFPPAGLKMVRDVQRRVAQQLRLGFWDWEARMGGRCTAVSWVKLQPTRMRGDYVHFNSAGGQEIATRLQTDLDAAANAVR